MTMLKIDKNEVEVNRVLDPKLLAKEIEKKQNSNIIVVIMPYKDGFGRGLVNAMDTYYDVGSKVASGEVEEQSPDSSPIDGLIKLATRSAELGMDRVTDMLLKKIGEEL